MSWFPFVLRSRYEELERHCQRLSLENSVRKREVDRLKINLNQARKNDYRDEKGRFTKRKDA